MLYISSKRINTYVLVLGATSFLGNGSNRPLWCFLFYWTLIAVITDRINIQRVTYSPFWCNSLWRKINWPCYCEGFFSTHADTVIFNVKTMSAVFLTKGQNAMKLKYMYNMIVNTAFVVESLTQEIVIIMRYGNSQVFHHHG